MAGGLGTRLKEKSSGELKIFSEIAGKKFFEYFENNLKLLGFHKVIYIVDNNKKNVEQIYDKTIFKKTIVLTDGDKRLGTGGSIINNLNKLPEYFWVMYGDTLLNWDVKKSEEYFFKYCFDLMMLVIHSKYVSEVPNVEIDLIKQRLVKYNKSDLNKLQYVDYGATLFRKETLLDYPKNSNFDLEIIIQDKIQKGNSSFQVVKNKFYEMGNIDSFIKLENLLKQKKINHNLLDLWK